MRLSNFATASAAGIATIGFTFEHEDEQGRLIFFEDSLAARKALTRSQMRPRFARKGLVVAAELTG